jgi:GxxExxY protein
MKHEEITSKMIGCAMQFHRKLGNGFQEVIYQRALAIEMQLASLFFEREKEIDIYYRSEIIGKRRADFLLKIKSRRVKSINKIRRWASVPGHELL